MSKETKERICKNCIFWQENPYRGMASVTEELITGDCHRNPPSTDGHLTFFPTTKSKDWCGEFSDGIKMEVKPKKGGLVRIFSKTKAKDESDANG